MTLSKIGTLVRCLVGVPAAAVILLGVAYVASAATYTWGPTGSGEWTTTGNWNVAGFPNAIDDIARLDKQIASTASITIASPITIGTLRFGDTGSTYRATNFSGGPITMDVSSGNAVINKVATAAAGTLIDNINANITLNDSLDLTNANTATGSKLTIGGNITEGVLLSGVNKLGTGVVTLSGTNSYTGATTVSAGILTITTPLALYNNGAATAWSANKIVVNSGAMLNLSVAGAGFSSSAVQTIAGLGTGSGGFATDSYLGLDTTIAGDTALSANLSNANGVIVTKTGTNKLTLTGNNNVRMAVQSGTLQFATRNSLLAGNSANWTASNVGVLSGATVAFNVGGAGEFTPADIATLAALGTATGGFQAGSILAIDTSNAVSGTTLVTSIADTNGGANSLGLAKQGVNSLVLAAANTFSGPTTLSGGELVLADSNALQNSAYSNAGGTLTFSSVVASHQFTIGALVGSTGIDLHDNAANNVNLTIGKSSGDYSGTLSGSGNLTKAGTGTQIFSGFNSFTGHTTINGGAMQYSSDGAIGGTGGADVTVNTGGTAAAAYSFGIDQSFLARVVPGSTGVVALAAASSNTLDFSASGANLPAVSLGATGAFAFTGTIIPNGTTYRLGGGTASGKLTLSNANALTGAGNSVIFSANGTAETSAVIIANTNDYGAGTTLNSGTLVISAPGITSSTAVTDSGQLGTGPITLNGGIIDTVNSNTAAAQTHILNNQVIVPVGASVTLRGAGTTSGTLGNLQFSGPITGSGRLVVDGGSTTTPATGHSGQINFAGNLTGFTGTIEHYIHDTAGGGTGSAQAALVLFTGAAIDASTVKIELHGAQNFSSNGKSLRFDATSGGGSGIAKLGELAGDGGIIRATGGPANLEVGYLNTDSSYGGGFGDVGTSLLSLTKVGTGTLTLSNVQSSYTGTTTVRAGTLAITEDVASPSVIGSIATAGWDAATDTVTTTVDPQLSVGDRVQFGNSFPTGLNASTAFYVVGTPTATAFQVSLTQGGAPVDLTGTSAASTFFRVGTLGSTNTAVQLGDLGSTTTATITLRIDAAKTFARPISINATPGASTTSIGGGTNENSTFAGNITLAKNLTIMSSATGPNAVTISGGISVSSVGSKTVTFAGPGNVNITTIGIDNGSGTVQVVVSGGSVTFNSVSNYTGTTTVNSGATVGGAGSINASALTVNAGGNLAPGAGIGELSVGSAAIAGTLAIQYSGDLSSIDKLSVGGALNITNAILDFEHLGSADLSGGPFVFASYGSLVGGTFASVLDLPVGYSIDYHFGGNQIALVSSGILAGDFDSDGDIDGADFIAWQTHYPTTSSATLATGDANGDGKVNGVDFAIWKNGFPTSPSATAAVPEPAGVVLALIAAAPFAIVAGKRKSSVDPVIRAHLGAASEF